MLSAQSWRPEAVARMVMWLFVCLSVGSLAIYFLNPEPGAPLPAELKFPALLIGTMAFHGSALILVGMLLKEHFTGWRDAFGLANAPREAVSLGIAAAIVILPLMLGLVLISSSALTSLDQEPVSQEIVLAVREADSVSQLIAFGAVAVVLAPVVEELLFRGILYPTVVAAGFPRVARWGTSVLFAAVHANLLTFVPLLILALMLVWLYEKSRNLLAPIVAHALFNAANFYQIITPPPGS